MIFILGGRGFVGSGFVDFFTRSGLEFTVITRDNYAHYRGRSCNILVNANGNSSKLLAARQPIEDFDASVRSVRASLVDFRFDTYVYLSSVDVYSDCSPRGNNHEQSPFDPAAQSPYGFHKALAEQCVRHAAPRWLIARLGGGVGPGLRKNAIFDIASGRALWVDPASRLQFLHTADAARLVWELLGMGLTCETYNVCGRGTISPAEVIELLGTSVQVMPDSPRVHYEVSIDKLLSVCTVPETTDTVARFLSQQRFAQRRACPSRSIHELCTPIEDSC